MYVLEYISTNRHSIKEGKIFIKLLSEVTSGKWEREERLDYFIKKCSCVLTVFVFLLVFESLALHIFFKKSKYFKICAYFFYGCACVCVCVPECVSMCRTLVQGLVEV